MEQERKPRRFHYQVALAAGDADLVEATINVILREINPRDLEEVEFDVLDAQAQTFRAVVRYKVWTEE